MGPTLHGYYFRRAVFFTKDVEGLTIPQEVGEICFHLGIVAAAAETRCTWLDPKSRSCRGTCSVCAYAHEDNSPLTTESVRKWIVVGYEFLPQSVFIVSLDVLSGFVRIVVLRIHFHGPR